MQKIIIIVYILFMSVEVVVGRDVDTVIIDAGKKIYHGEGKYWDLIGKPKVQNGNDLLNARIIKYYVDEKRVEGKGKVRLFDYDEGIEVFGNIFNYFVNTKNARLVGNTKLIGLKDNITLNGGILQRIGTNKYVAREDVRITAGEEGTNANAGVVTYNIKLREILLEDGPVIHEKGKQYKANRIKILLNEKDIILDGNAKIEDGNRHIRANYIRYNYGQTKKALLKGETKIEELSSKNSLLNGKPYKVLQAGKITYYNTEPARAILEYKPVVYEYYIRKEESKDKVEKFSKKGDDKLFYGVYKRTGRASLIKYRLKEESTEYALIGNAQVNDYESAAFADRIDYKEGGGVRVGVMRGSAVFYILDVDEKDIRNKIKIKGKAKVIKYYPDKEIVNLEGNARVEQRGDKSLSAGYISYNLKTEEGYAKDKIKLREGDTESGGQKLEFRGNSKLILEGGSYYKAKDFKASANYIEYDDEKGEALLIGNGKILDAKNKASGDKIEYKRLGGKGQTKDKVIRISGSGKIEGKGLKGSGEKIYYKTQGNKEVLNLYNNAILEREDSTGYAKEIIYYNIPKRESKEDDEKVILKGGVKIVEPDVTVEGDEIEVYTYANNPEYSDRLLVKGNSHIMNRNDYKQSYADKVLYTKDRQGNEEFILEGNGELVDEKLTGFADKIIFRPSAGDGNKEKYIMVGEPYIQLEDSIISGRRIEIELDEDETQIEVREDGQYINTVRRIKIFADVISYKVNEEIMQARGNAVYKDRDQELTFFADRIIRYGKNRESVALNNIKIVQGKKSLYGNQGKYYEEKEILEILNNASVVEESSYVSGDKIILNAKTKEIVILGRREGGVKIVGEDNNRDNSEDDNSKETKKETKKE